MKNTHENKMLFCTAIFSIFVSLCVVGLCLSYGNKLKRMKSDPVPMLHIESQDSKIITIAMRCHTLEQEMDMLRLRIEELEENNGVTNEEYVVCGQYWLYQAGITNEPAKQQETNVINDLAVDDLVP